MFPCMPVKR